MVKAYFDIETDGLEATRIHCICAMTDWDNTVVNFLGDKCYEDFREWLVYEGVETLVGHNIIGFDIPVLRSISNDLYNYNLRDTLIISRLLNPSMDGGHSLKAWGERLTNTKDDYDGGWEEFSIEMLKYCQQDVRVTKDLSNHLDILLDGTDQQAVDIEHKVAEIIQQQEQNGVLFDERKAYDLLAELKEKVLDIENKVRKVFKPLPTWKSLNVLKNPKRKDGSNSLAYQKQLDKGAHYDADYDDWGYIDYPEFNLGSRQQISRYLMHFGWNPREFTEKGSVIVNEKVLEGVNIPEVKLIVEYLTLTKRLAMVRSWLESVTDDGRIHGRVNTCGAITGRMTHSNPNLAQVPAVYSEYGKECRELWTVPTGKKLVGVDASGLELRMLAHYMNDKEYTKEVVDGDIHKANQMAAGLQSRDKAKTFIYAFLYGAGDRKIGEVVSGTAKDGAKLKSKFLDNTPSLKTLRKQVSNGSTKGWIKGLDGRRLIIRSQHSALNVLLQSAGAIVMKQALILLEKYARIYKIDYKFVLNVHDEFQLEVCEKQAEQLGGLAVDCIKRAGLDFKLNCPLDGEYKVGETWAETH